MRARDLFAAIVLCVPLAVAAQPADYRIETLTEGLEHPWSLAFLPDGGMLVTERVGRLRRIDAGGVLHPDAVAGVPRAHVAGQAGLFEVALSPDFATSRRVYLSYVCGDAAANNTCLARATLDGSTLIDVQTVFEAQPKKRGNAHYGGRIAFLPDGTLLLTLGDGFDYREQAQDTGNHLGTIVRLNGDGTAPHDNPFGNEVWSYGHRNVQGIVYDDETRRVLSHEHGPRGGDEINVIEPGANYGWPVATSGVDYSGAMITPYDMLPGTVAPIFQWTPSIAPSGLALYRAALFSQWRGDLLVGALAARAVYRVRLGQGKASEQERLFGELKERIRDVRVGPEGAVYLLTDSVRGRVLRVLPAAGR